MQRAQLQTTLLIWGSSLLKIILRLQSICKLFRIVRGVTSYEEKEAVASSHFSAVNHGDAWKAGHAFALDD